MWEIYEDKAREIATLSPLIMNLDFIPSANRRNKFLLRVTLSAIDLKYRKKKKA